MSLSIEQLNTAQYVTNLITSIGVAGTLLALFFQIKNYREDKVFEAFTRMLALYKKIVQKRKNSFKKIKEKILENPDLQQEMHDKQNSLSYLLLRQEQKEALFAIEHQLLDLEIKSLNFLNELIKISEKEERARRMLLLNESNEISYYQNRLTDLMKLYQSEKEIRLFPTPQYDYLNTIEINKFYNKKF